jgi:CRISPR/Cas system Type II protein with McrA/HNH and RuvC-like nuclease domain
MGLTLQMEQDILAANLDKLFQRRRKRWIGVAQETYKYLRQNYPDDGTIRRDDVANAMRPVLEVTEELKGHLADERLSQKFWFSHFAHFIVDRCWDQIRAEEEDDDDEED